jgi:hypothetical protein
MSLTSWVYLMVACAALLLFVCGVFMGLAFKAPERTALSYTRAALVAALASAIPLCMAGARMWEALGLPK